MDKFRRTLSLKKKKDAGVESSKPHQWQEDERKVREGCCSFHVKYLGCIEVFESRGIQVCEEAVKALKNRKSRSIWSRMSLRRKKKDDNQQSKSGHHLAMLYVTGDALRVVDEISKGLIVDQTIEKVSFCAPDRNHDRGFAYICRDGTTRRWMCHGFLAVKESGERLSHAVGCAFAICLEKKQQREKEKVSVTYNDNGTSFTRLGSFRQASVTERLADPQSAIVAEPVPCKPSSNPYAVQRPHAPADMLERQGSFRSFQKLADSSPFKRNVSLRLNELPSNLERQKQFAGVDGPQITNIKNSICTIVETEEQDPFSPSPPLDAFASLQINHPPPPPPATINNNIPVNSTPSMFQDAITTSSFPIVVPPSLSKDPALPMHHDTQSLPITQSNPWASNENFISQTSEAESWLNATARKIDPFACAPSNNAFAARSQNLQHVQQQFTAMEPFTSVANHQYILSQTRPSFSMQQNMTGLPGYAGLAPIQSTLSYNHQFYPPAYQLPPHHIQPPQYSSSPATSAVVPPPAHQEASFFQRTSNPRQVVAGPVDPPTNSATPYGNSAPPLQNVQPPNSQPLAIDPFKSSATNPFKTGNDVSSFQLKI